MKTFPTRRDWKPLGKNFRNTESLFLESDLFHDADVSFSEHKSSSVCLCFVVFYLFV